MTNNLATIAALYFPEGGDRAARCLSALKRAYGDGYADGRVFERGIADKELKCWQDKAALDSRKGKAGE